MRIRVWFVRSGSMRMGQQEVASDSIRPDRWKCTWSRAKWPMRWCRGPVRRWNRRRRPRHLRPRRRHRRSTAVAARVAGTRTTRRTAASIASAAWSRRRTASRWNTPTSSSASVSGWRHLYSTKNRSCTPSTAAAETTTMKSMGSVNRWRNLWHRRRSAPASAPHRRHRRRAVLCAKISKKSWQSTATVVHRKQLYRTAHAVLVGQTCPMVATPKPSTPHRRRHLRPPWPPLILPKTSSFTVF